MKLKIVIHLLFITSSGFSQETTVSEEITQLFYRGYEQIYINKDSALDNFNKALKLAASEKDYTTQLEILDYNLFVCGYYYDMLNYRNNLEKVEHILAIDSLSSKIQNINYHKNQFQLNTGNYYYKLGDYSQAKTYFIEIYQQLSEREEKNLSEDEINTLLSIYNFLASIYKNTGKYDLAEVYYKKTISSALKVSSGKDLEITVAPTKLLLSQLYINMGEFDKANLLLQEVLNLYKGLYRTEKIYKNNLIAVYQTLIKNSIKQEKFLESLAYLKSCDQFITESDPFFKQSLLLYGQVLSELNNDAEALAFYKKALFAFNKYRNESPHEDVANIYAELSEFYLFRNNYQDGLKYINKAIINAGVDIQMDSIQSALTQNKFFSNRQILELLDLKNQHLMLAYQTTNNIKYLDEALKLNELILKTFQLLKKEFNSKLDKQYLLEEIQPVFTRMLGITFEAYQINSNRELLVSALNISEKSKDILLLDAIRDVNATSFNEVPQNIIDKELIYRSDINVTEKAIFNTVDAKEISSLNENLFQLKNDYYQYLDTLSKNYPAYYNLKYKDDKIDLEELRNNILDKNKLVISYTIADDYIYSISINKNKEQFLKIPFSKNMSDTITQFYSLITKPDLSGVEKLRSNAEQLYTSLLYPILKDFDEEELIIIQSGILHYIPFEVLIDNKGMYLLHSRTISYNSSLSSLMELKNKKIKNNGKLLAFAPQFENASRSLDVSTKFSPLLYNITEVKNINNHIRSDLYLDREANIKNFNEIASGYQVIHLATHATANDEFPDYSYLAFSESDSSASTLFIKDLYNKQINAQLVTLSACQTGIGQLQKGEGMMSMSKGFYYAGAKSIVKSLWKINDKSTALLMDNLYKELSKGKSKDEALRNAKLSYLASTDDEILKHPYYWAAFVVSGDTAAILSNYNLYFVIFGLLIILALVFLIFRKYRK